MEESYNITLKVSESEAKSIGQNRWSKRHKGRLLIIGSIGLGLSFLFCAFSIVFKDNLALDSLFFSLSIVSIISVAAYFVIGINKAGKRFLNKVKNHRQIVGGPNGVSLTEDNLKEYSKVVASVK